MRMLKSSLFHPLSWYVKICRYINKSVQHQTHFPEPTRPQKIPDIHFLNKRHWYFGERRCVKWTIPSQETIFFFSRNLWEWALANPKPSYETSTKWLRKVKLTSWVREGVDDCLFFSPHYETIYYHNYRCGHFGCISCWFFFKVTKMYILYWQWRHAYIDFFTESLSRRLKSNLLRDSHVMRTPVNTWLKNIWEVLSNERPPICLFKFNPMVQCTMEYHFLTIWMPR